MGYLNAKQPFDEDGWYNTNDLVDRDGDYFRIVGRTSEVINVGGLKFMGSEVERVALDFDEVEFVKVSARNNPLTGQHVELAVQVQDENNFPIEKYQHYLKRSLPSHMRPRKVTLSLINISNRFKRD